MTPLADTSDHYLFMQRCIALARLGNGQVAPNPMVGAILVHQGRILAEGWHQRYGQGHAEVNCLKAVKNEDQPLVRESTMYVSLEPCAHHGKTPPCADLIIQHQIPRVVVGCVDIFAQVAGKGIEKLKNAGIEVILAGPWNQDCIQLNRKFFGFHQHKRPYITLKWAKTADQFIAFKGQQSMRERLLITGPATNRLVHKWRSQSAAILVGNNTALKDDPYLNNRLYYGPSPIKMVLDPRLAVPLSAHLFEGAEPVVIFNFIKNKRLNTNETQTAPIHYVKLDPAKSVVPQIADYCYQEHIQSIFVEGGKMLLQSFIDAHYWDECRVITNTTLHIDDGLTAPSLSRQQFLYDICLGQDKISYFAPINISKDNLGPLTK